MENFDSGTFGPWTSNVSAEDFGLASRANRLLASKETASEIYREIFADPWDREKNPQGKINLCTAENNLCEDLLEEKIKSTPELFIPPLDYLYHYPTPGGYEHTKYAIARYLHKFMSVSGDPPLNIDHLVIVPGCTAAYDMLGFCLFNSGDVVLCPSPFYCRLYDNFQERAQVEGKIPRAISLIVPHNPLGVVFTEEEILNLCQFCVKHNLHIIVDEVFFCSVSNEYNPRKSLLSLRNYSDAIKNRLVWMWGISKEFCLPGVRFAVIHTENEGLLKALRRLEIMQPCPPLVQHFVTQILNDHDWVQNFHQEKNRRLQENRLLAMKRLDEIQVPYVKANAGLFLYIDLRMYLSDPTFDAERFLWTRMCYSRIYLNPGQFMGTPEPGWFRLVISGRQDALEEGLNRLAKMLSYLPRRDLPLQNQPLDVPITISTREIESRLSKESGIESGPSSEFTSPLESLRSFVKIRKSVKEDDQKTLDGKLAIIAGQRKSDTLSSIASRESYSSGKSDDTIINLVFGSPETTSVKSFETTIFRPDGSVISEGVYRMGNGDENPKPDIIHEPIHYSHNDHIAEAHALIDLVDEYYVEESTESSNPISKNPSAFTSQDSVVKLCSTENQRYRKLVTQENPYTEFLEASTLKRRKPVRHKESIPRKKRPNSAEEGYGELKEIRPMLRVKQASEERYLDESEEDLERSRGHLNVEVANRSMADDSGVDLKPPSNLVSPKSPLTCPQASTSQDFDSLTQKRKTTFKDDGTIETQTIRSLHRTQDLDLDRLIAIEASKRPNSAFTEDELLAIINRVPSKKEATTFPSHVEVRNATLYVEPSAHRVPKVDFLERRSENLDFVQQPPEGSTFTEDELLAIVNRPKDPNWILTKSPKMTRKSEPQEIKTKPERPDSTYGTLERSFEMSKSHEITQEPQEIMVYEVAYKETHLPGRLEVKKRDPRALEIHEKSLEIEKLSPSYTTDEILELISGKDPQEISKKSRKSSSSSSFSTSGAESTSSSVKIHDLEPETVQTSHLGPHKMPKVDQMPQETPIEVQKMTISRLETSEIDSRPIEMFTEAEIMDLVFKQPSFDDGHMEAIAEESPKTSKSTSFDEPTPEKSSGKAIRSLDYQEITLEKFEKPSNEEGIQLLKDDLMAFHRLDEQVFTREAIEELLLKAKDVWREETKAEKVENSVMSQVKSSENVEKSMENIENVEKHDPDVKTLLKNDEKSALEAQKSLDDLENIKKFESKSQKRSETTVVGEFEHVYEQVYTKEDIEQLLLKARDAQKTKEALENDAEIVLKAKTSPLEEHVHVLTSEKPSETVQKSSGVLPEGMTSYDLDPEVEKLPEKVTIRSENEPEVKPAIVRTQIYTEQDILALITRKKSLENRQELPKTLPNTADVWSPTSGTSYFTSHNIMERRVSDQDSKKHFGKPEIIIEKGPEKVKNLETEAQVASEEVLVKYPDNPQELFIKDDLEKLIFEAKNQEEVKKIGLILHQEAQKSTETLPEIFLTQDLSSSSTSYSSLDGQKQEFLRLDSKESQFLLKSEIESDLSRSGTSQKLNLGQGKYLEKGLVESEEVHKGLYLKEELKEEFSEPTDIHKHADVSYLPLEDIFKALDERITQKDSSKMAQKVPVTSKTTPEASEEPIEASKQTLVDSWSVPKPSEPHTFNIEAPTINPMSKSRSSSTSSTSSSSTSSSANAYSADQDESDHLDVQKSSHFEVQPHSAPAKTLFHDDELHQLIEETRRKSSEHRKATAWHVPLDRVFEPWEHKDRAETHAELQEVKKMPKTKRVKHHKKSETSDEEVIACKCSKEAQEPILVFTEEEIVGLIRERDAREAAERQVQLEELEKTREADISALGPKVVVLEPSPTVSSHPEAYILLEKSSGVSLSMLETDSMPLKPSEIIEKDSKVHEKPSENLEKRLGSLEKPSDAPEKAPIPIEPKVVIVEKLAQRQEASDVDRISAIRRPSIPENFTRHRVESIKEEEDDSFEAKIEEIRPKMAVVESKIYQTEKKLDLDVVFAFLNQRIAQEKFAISRWQEETLPEIRVSRPTEATPPDSDEEFEPIRSKIEGSSPSTDSSEGAERKGLLESDEPEGKIDLQRFIVEILNKSEAKTLKTVPVAPSPSLSSIGCSEGTEVNTIQEIKSKEASVKPLDVQRSVKTFDDTSEGIKFDMDQIFTSIDVRIEAEKRRQREEEELEDLPETVLACELTQKTEPIQEVRTTKLVERATPKEASIEPLKVHERAKTPENVSKSQQIDLDLIFGSNDSKVEAAQHEQQEDSLKPASEPVLACELTMKPEFTLENRTGEQVVEIKPKETSIKMVEVQKTGDLQDQNIDLNQVFTPIDARIKAEKCQQELKTLPEPVLACELTRKSDIASKLSLETMPIHETTKHTSVELPEPMKTPKPASPVGVGPLVLSETKPPQEGDQLFLDLIFASIDSRIQAEETRRQEHEKLKEREPVLACELTRKPEAALEPLPKPTDHPEVSKIPSDVIEMSEKSTKYQLTPSGPLFSDEELLELIKNADPSSYEPKTVSETTLRHQGVTEISSDNGLHQPHQDVHVIESSDFKIHESIHVFETQPIVEEPDDELPHEGLQVQAQVRKLTPNQPYDDDISKLLTFLTMKKDDTRQFLETDKKELFERVDRFLEKHGHKVVQGSRKEGQKSDQARIEGQESVVPQKVEYRPVFTKEEIEELLARSHSEASKIKKDEFLRHTEADLSLGEPKIRKEPSHEPLEASYFLEDDRNPVDTLKPMESQVLVQKVTLTETSHEDQTPIYSKDDIETLLRHSEDLEPTSLEVDQDLTIRRRFMVLEEPSLDPMSFEVHKESHMTSSEAVVSLEKYEARSNSPKMTQFLDETAGVYTKEEIERLLANAKHQEIDIKGRKDDQLTIRRRFMVLDETSEESRPVQTQTTTQILTLEQTLEPQAYPETPRRSSELVEPPKLGLQDVRIIEKRTFELEKLENSTIYTKEDIEELLASATKHSKSKHDQEESVPASSETLPSIHDTFDLYIDPYEPDEHEQAWHAHHKITTFEELTPLYSKEELEAILALEKAVEGFGDSGSLPRSIRGYDTLKSEKSKDVEGIPLEMVFFRAPEDSTDQKEQVDTLPRDLEGSKFIITSKEITSEAVILQDEYTPRSKTVQKYAPEEISLPKNYDSINLDLVFSIFEPKSGQESHNFILERNTISPSSSIVQINAHETDYESGKRVRSPAQDIGFVQTTYLDQNTIQEAHYIPEKLPRHQVHLQEDYPEVAATVELNNLPLKSKNEVSDEELKARIHQTHTEIKVTSRPRRSSHKDEKHVVVEHVNITEMVYVKDEFEGRKIREGGKLVDRQKSMLKYFPIKDQGPRYYVVEKFNPSDSYDLDYHSHASSNSYSEDTTSTSPFYDLTIGLNDSHETTSRDVAIQTSNPVDLCCRLRVVSKKSNIGSHFVPESSIDVDEHQRDEFVVCRNPKHTESGHHCCSKKLYTIKSSTMTNDRGIRISSNSRRRPSESFSRTSIRSSNSSISSSNSIDRISVRHHPVSTSWIVSSVYKSTPFGYERCAVAPGLPVTIFPDVVRVDINKDAK